MEIVRKRAESQAFGGPIRGPIRVQTASAQQLGIGIMNDFQKKIWLGQIYSMSNYWVLNMPPTLGEGLSRIQVIALLKPVRSDLA